MSRLSVCLCTWNNSRRLALTLDALARCASPVPWELVVVNNNCTDGTDAVVSAMSGRLPIVYVHEPKQGLSNARNAAVRRASGELIIFTDDDVTPCANWLEEYWRAYQQHPAGRYWGGPVESAFDAPVNPALVRYAPHSVKGLDWGSEDKPLGADERFIAANWGCPRKALPSESPFDPNLGLNPQRGMTVVGEESALMGSLQRVGYRPHYLARARIRHHVPAEKVSLRHVADRRRASARFRALQAPPIAGRLRIAGAPLWMWRFAGRLYLRWWRVRMNGRDGINECIRWAQAMGEIDAAREQHRQARSAFVGERVSRA
jgi:glucosyl-dolichyl phosphate glucuronosyltransferase